MFVYNVPGGLAAGLEEEFGITVEQISSLMTAYTIPSAVTAVVAAEALAVIGLTPVCFICSTIVLIGSFVFALSPTFDTTEPYFFMMIGQLLNGSGDSLGLACSPAMVARWFRHSH